MMLKRRREVDDDPSVRHTVHKGSLSKPQKERLKDVLAHSTKILFRSMKLGRGFERQKLGRRQKDAKKSYYEVEIKRIEAEITALKSLDLQSLAELHLFKSILRIKSFVSLLPSFVRSKVEQTGPPISIAHANVQARLFNSNPVKTAMEQCIDSISSSLGLVENAKKKKKRLRKADFQTPSDEPSHKLSTDKSNTAAGEDSLGKKETSSVHDGRSVPDSPPMHQKESWSSNASIDFDLHTDRQAELSSESEGSTELDGHESERRQGYEHDRSRSGSSDASPSPNPSDSYAGSLQHRHAASRPTSKSIAKSDSSRFLPSLMGGYWSGSDSGGEIEDLADAKQRKNRRGQRERQKIAELKYGQRARHVQKQTRERTRDHGWDPRRGARTSDPGDKFLKSGGGPNKSRGKQVQANKEESFRSGANSDPVKPRRLDQKPKPDLHPSWEAAKKAKEHKIASSFQGKKKVFE